MKLMFSSVLNAPRISAVTLLKASSVRSGQYATPKQHCRCHRTGNVIRVFGQRKITPGGQEEVVEGLDEKVQKGTEHDDC